MKESRSMKYFQTAFERWFRASGLKQFQAGIQLGISQSLVAKLLRGERGLSFAQADEIAKALNTTVIDMLIEGRNILNENKNPHENSGLSYEQKNALKAFEDCLISGGEAAEMLAKNAIDLAKRKQAEAGFKQQPHQKLSA